MQTYTLALFRGNRFKFIQTLVSHYAGRPHRKHKTEAFRLHFFVEGSTSASMLDNSSNLPQISYMGYQ